MVQDINWGNFKAKFNRHEQSAFEHLCYLLFCKEHNRNTGVLRFKNQVGIETNPVENDGRVVGWQAKFYDTKLSENKADIYSSIDKTKERYTTVDRIIFYTNQEFGQGKKAANPQYKTEIEDFARQRQIDIIWRTASYFESPFVCEQNHNIAQHFFSLRPGILDSINSLTTYTEAVLRPIRSEILYKDKAIKIERAEIEIGIREAVDNRHPIIVSGAAGVGKTAMIKSFYERVKNDMPLYVFKASQFKNISHVNEIFKHHGEISLTDLIDEHQDFQKKFVIIDSAERLSEIDDHDIFKMFLSRLIENKWTPIFTVRYSYLDDLRLILRDEYEVPFSTVSIPQLSIEELKNFADQYSFRLPKNERLLALLCTPLYLNEYLKGYSGMEENLSYSEFREIIWKKQIQDSVKQSKNIHRRREDCFLTIAHRRVTGGSFFVAAEDCDQEALQKLQSDEIIQYDSNTRGYFITHDIYEEWAIDRIIEQAFSIAPKYVDFYEQIGNSLPIRRGFRNWLSDKLFSNDDIIKSLIESTIRDSQIESHWRDEVLISVLLSDYSKVFFDVFEDSLIQEIQGVSSDKLLHKILFLIQIACKTIDEDFVLLLGGNAASASWKTIFTKPKGKGWDSTISFINKHKEKLQLLYMHPILSILNDWNQNHREGETTRNASKVALFYYQELSKQEGFSFRTSDDLRDKLITTILQGSGEIRSELTEILNEIVTKKEISKKGKYYPLVKAILSSVIESSEITKHLPDEVIKLADLFWFDVPREKAGLFSNYTRDIEYHFGLSERHLEYTPSSAFQTPIFPLLQNHPQKAVDFVLSLTNKAIAHYSKSELAREEVWEINVSVNGAIVQQYIGPRIWCLYRGTQVGPSMLVSAHMALERWLLMVAKSFKSKTIETWCLYLLKNSRSTSITAIVVSVVLAEPAKLFNVAKILFSTKDFFLFDTSRVLHDTQAKSLYSISHDPSGIFTKERVMTCDDKHRSSSLENILLHYQLFALDGETEDVVEQRQECIWKILDHYYEQLPKESEQGPEDKTWRLYLARMDRRKMKIKTEQRENRVLFNFEPELEPELVQYRESFMEKISESTKHHQLHFWAKWRFDQNSKYKQYSTYETDHKLVISEVKEIVKKKEGIEPRVGLDFLQESIPAIACAVLIRDFHNKLNPKEKAFCRDILLNSCSLPLSEHYDYQIGDGVKEAIEVLPHLLNLFPSYSKEIKEIMIFTLLDMHPMGMSQRFYEFSVNAIRNYMWQERSEDANSLFLGFLFLKPKYDALRADLLSVHRLRHIYGVGKTDLNQSFYWKFKSTFDRISSNEIEYSEIGSIAQTHPVTLLIALNLIPNDSKDEMHKRFFMDTFPVFAKLLFQDPFTRRKSPELEFTDSIGFFKKLAYIVLSNDSTDVVLYTTPFLENFSNSEGVSQYFQEFVSAEDRLSSYDQFWQVWKMFYTKIQELAKTKDDRLYSGQILRNYLLAWNYWREDAKEWHTLKDREKEFFKNVSEEMGQSPTVLYSLAKILNEIGSGFLVDGINWISHMLKNNANLTNDPLEINTVYYIENLTQRFILQYRQQIRTHLPTKTDTLVILDFLISKGSVIGYLLRERIL